jgi:hypothetical protein
MSERLSDPRVSKDGPAANSAGLRTSLPSSSETRSLDIQKHSKSSHLRRIVVQFPVLLILFISVAALLAAGVVYAFILCSPRTPGIVASRSSTAPAADWQQEPDTAEERICARFIELKNAGHPVAFQMLGPAPAVPNGPVSQAEADGLQTDFFLRQDVRIVGVGRDRRSGALVLYTKGNVFAPTLQVKTATGAQTAQRTMSNPDLTVEVRDGRIYGVAAGLHVGP